MSHQTVSVKTYAAVYIALMLLLVLTVAAAFVPMGNFGPVVAMTIAVAKAVLIMMFFMHLFYDISLTRIFAVSGFAWLLILFTILLSDYLTRSDVVWAG